MATLLLNSIKNVCGPLRQKSKFPNLVLFKNVRALYTPEALGTDTFLKQQYQIQTQMHNIEHKFREKMIVFSVDDSKNMIFTEDLKNMIHLAKSDDDLDLVVKMIKKFNQQNKQLRFGSFVFGPVVMRLFHINNKPDLALECFTAPELTGFFDQIISYQLLMDLLYENKRYDEVLKTFEIIKDRQLHETKYPKNIVVLAFAACYKLNSQKSLQYALSLWEELSKVGHIPMRRASTFCAGLALRQGHPEVALEIISTVKNPNYTTIRNIRVAALAEIGRVDDTLPILKSVLTDDRPSTIQHTFNVDVMKKIEAAVKEFENEEISLEFNRILSLFKSQGHISNITLDEQLCVEIQKPPQNNRQENIYSRFNPNIQSNNNRKTTRLRSRPGLQDIA